jgi:3-oxoacyl-[acyl-carrier protein] reductase
VNVPKPSPKLPPTYKRLAKVSPYSVWACSIVGTLNSMSNASKRINFIINKSKESNAIQMWFKINNTNVCCNILYKIAGKLMRMAEIIITGASGGIGSALCRVFLDGGHRVMAISRKESVMDVHPNLEWVQNSLDNYAEIRNAVDSWSEGSGLRILIHNAGYMIRKAFMEIEQSEMEELMHVNLIYPCMLTKALLGWLSNGDAGHTIYISSMSGFQGSLKYPGLTAYGASKSAGNAWIESMAAEFDIKQGLYFNALSLGAVNTSMLKDAIPNTTSAVEVREMARFIFDFALDGFKVMNGVVLPVRISNP